TQELKEISKSLTFEVKQIEKDIQQRLYAIPNIPHDLVPEGSNENDNEVIKEGALHVPELPDNAQPHWELIKSLDILDFDLGNKVTGAGFPFYKGKGARLNRALINLFIDHAVDAGYLEYQPPFVVNESSGIATGQLPDKEGQMYQLQDTSLFLIPTAEVPLTNIYRDEILHADDLPIKLVGHTPCFRKEAGSWGSHVRGLNRLHQFDKVELVQISQPESSYEVLDEMVNHVEQLLIKLELPYRILRLCAGDLGFTSAMTYDFEVYSAAQKKWLEVSSVSNFETYQANRLKLRMKDKQGKKELAHTLNGSALALPRIVAALLENNQTNMTIKLPAILKTYTGFDFIGK
ncbi:MAG: serine--tRNA ligase, partial [Bacteroidota bacterium]